MIEIVLVDIEPFRVELLALHWGYFIVTALREYLASTAPCFTKFVGLYELYNKNANIPFTLSTASD